MQIRLILAALMVALCLPLAASAESIVLTSSLDNTLFEQPNASMQTSSGLGDSMFVGRTNMGSNSIRRGLVQFQLEGEIPDNATITGVALTMRETTGMNGDHATVLKRVLTSWGEGTSAATGGAGATATNGDATWLFSEYNTDPGLRVSWTPGGNFESVISASTVVDDDAGPQQAAFFTWSSSEPGNSQMITDVQFWVDNPSSNFGWVILGNESAPMTAKRFNTKDSGFAPELEVTFVVPEPSSLVLAALGSLVGLVFARRRLCH